MFNWHSYDLLATTSGTYLKASARFNNPSLTLFVTFTFYTHISLAFSTRMLIRSALIFSDTHSCLLFCHLSLKLLPFASVTQHSEFSSFISPSCLSPYFALCLLLDNTNVVFNIFSALAIWFHMSFLFPSPLPLQGKEDAHLVLCFQTRWEVTFWHVTGSWLCITHSSGYCMRPLKYFSFSLSLFLKSRTVLQWREVSYLTLLLLCPL